MAIKLGRNEMPAGHTREDFQCFGPVVDTDTKFAGCKLAEFGCFKQDEGTDSNKYYFACVCQSTKTKEWFKYVEYGRTKDGAPDKPQYQFTKCSSEYEAMDEFCDQCADKNTKRGKWEKVGSKERYVPRIKKDGSTEDLYVVRYMASRAVGLPSAKNICNQDAVGAQVVVTTKKKSVSKVDPYTKKLFRDLMGGTVKYTKSIMVGGTMPAVSAISDARDLLQDALARIQIVGNKVDDQVADKDLKRLTYLLYGMVPKTKAPGLPEKDWILSADNVGRWQDDLDAFESALKSADVEETVDDDVMQGIPANVEWLDLNSELGKWLAHWWVSSTRNVHGHGKLKIHNLWRVNRHGDDDIFNQNQERTLGEMPKSQNVERPMFNENQKQRPDLNIGQRKMYYNTNSALLFHASRSVNVTGIIRENFRLPHELAKTGVVINGSMFGPGVYHADDWGKSANYCSVSFGRSSMYVGSDGHVAGRHSFMFGVDAILGIPYVAPGSHGFTQPPAGHHSVFGKAGHTASWGRARGLMNNEWIIYRKGRNIIRYLAEVSW